MDMGQGNEVVLRSSRRTVVRGAAWSVPVVAAATAAPAFAASCHDPASVDYTWNVNRYYRANRQTVDRGYGYVRTDSANAAYFGQDPDGAGSQLATNVTISVAYGSNVQADVDQLFASDINVGGTGAPGLTLHQTPRNTANMSSSLTNANKSVVTFAFSRVISELTFTMTDIDSASGDFRDAVGISGATISSYSIQNTAQVGGVGSVTNPFAVIPTNSAIDNASGNGGNVTVTLTNVSTFDLHYWNVQPPSSGGGDQKVYLTNFSLKYTSC